MYQDILLWPCCTKRCWHQTGGCGEMQLKYSQIQKGIDNLDMVVDFIHFISECYQFHDNSSRVIVPPELHFMTPQTDYDKGCWEIWLSWWRHQMETFSALLALCAGNSPVPETSPHKGQWRGSLMLPLICAWINDRVNNREAGDLRRHRGHYDVNVMYCGGLSLWSQ